MDGKEQIRVVLADDHPMLRIGLRAVLEPELTIRVTGQAASFPELLKLLPQIDADVVLLDLGNMGAQPVTAVSSLVRTYPRLAIIIFTSTLSGAREIIKLGARGYVAKEDMEDAVITAIQVVMSGQTYLSPMVSDYLERSGGLQTAYGMTDKEWEVARLMAEGLGTDDIAVRLVVAEQTVRNYIHALYEKTRCRTRIQLVDWYRRVAGSSS